MKSIKLIINIIITAISVLFSPINSFGQQNFNIEGDIKGFGENYFLVRYFQNGVQIEDPIKANKGQFHFSVIQSDGNIINLIFNNNTTFIIFLDEPLVKIEGILNTKIELSCKNTAENNLLELYRNSIQKPYETLKIGKTFSESDEITLNEEAEIRKLIKNYPNNFISAYLLYWQSMNNITIFDEIEQLLTNFAPNVRNSYWANKTQTRIFNIRNRPKVGKKIPNFELPDSTDNITSLESLKLKGKFILLDFWGTWCKPCIQSMPTLNAIQSKYTNELVLISIAYESPNDKEKWRKAIRKYEMNWLNVVDHYEESVNELYNIYEYPTLLLVSPDGILIEKIKYEGSNDLEKRIAELIKK